MSTASPLPDDTFPTTASTLQHMVTTPIKATAFWTAIATPLAYPALLAGGLTGGEVSLLGLVFVLNVVALIVGRDYKTE